MKLRISKQLDTVRILLREGVAIEESDEAENGLILDYDSDGHVVGIEFTNATARFGDLSVLINANAVPTHKSVPKNGFKVALGKTKKRNQRRRKEELVRVYTS